MVAVKKCPFVLPNSRECAKLACAPTYPRPRWKVKHVTLLVESYFKFQRALLVQTKEPEELITRFTVNRRSSRNQLIPGKIAECLKKSQRSVPCVFEETSCLCLLLGANDACCKLTLAQAAKLAFF